MTYAEWQHAMFPAVPLQPNVQAIHDLFASLISSGLIWIPIRLCILALFARQIAEGMAMFFGPHGPPNWGKRQGHDDNI